MISLRHIAGSVAYILGDSGPYAEVDPTDVTIEFTPAWVRWDDDEFMTYDGPHDITVTVPQRTILATDKWKSNAELIADMATLGYLDGERPILDPTYGKGTFWKVFHPDTLVASDIVQAKSPCGVSVDFTAMPWGDRSFHDVVYDGPYKLNGRPDEEVDDRYGVATMTRWQDRMELLGSGLRECARVLGDGHLLVKCQDQVCSGKIRWQTIYLTEIAEECGLDLVDRFNFMSYRPQGKDVRQVHARQNSSQLLVFKRGRPWRPVAPLPAAYEKWNDEVTEEWEDEVRRAALSR